MKIESIEKVTLPHDAPKELFQLQDDAKRCIAQAEELKKLNPGMTERYEAQKKACLADVNAKVRNFIEGEEGCC